MAKTIELWIDHHKLVARAYNEDKSGTPIIFIHGITNSVDLWEAILPPEIKACYRWYSLSLPGHYPATMPPNFKEEDLSADMIGRVLAEAVSRLVEDKPVILVGHSTGGFAVLNLGAHASNPIKGIVSVSGFAQGKWIGALGIFQHIAAIPLIGGALYQLSYWLIGRNRAIWGQSCRLYAADVDTLLRHPAYWAGINGGHENFKQLDLKIMAMYFRRMLSIDISDKLPQIHVPTLVISGDQDPTVPPSQSRLIAEKVEGSELVMIEGAGHALMLEREAEYNRAFSTWIEKHAHE
jgi:pimeloyl-ACP methyl ester carboxylesterase